MNFPGTPQHRELLRAIVAFYADDARVLAVSVFGSLGRGNWDAYSDLDLDVVVTDGIQIEIIPELTRLCESLGEQVALIIPDGDAAGDVVLESLMEFSIRFHPLRTTSPNIVDSLQVLAGPIDAATIQAAGMANRRQEEESPSRLLDRCLRYALETANALQRGNLWSAVELLHRMRGLVMELFARTHGGTRAYQFFQSDADGNLQSRLGATLPQYDSGPAHDCLTSLLDLLENDLARLTDGQLELSTAQRQILRKLRMR